MTKSDTVTCSFKVDRVLYEGYKEILAASGESVKTDMTHHMAQVVMSGARRGVIPELSALMPGKKRRRKSSPFDDLEGFLGF